MDYYNNRKSNYNRNNDKWDLLSWKRKIPINDQQLNISNYQTNQTNESYKINKDFWKPDKSVSSWYLASIGSEL